jgi:hypothetical protein
MREILLPMGTTETHATHMSSDDESPPSSIGPRVTRVMYEIVSDEEFLAILGDGWHWIGELGEFECSIGQEKPPFIVTVSSSTPGDPASRQAADDTPGPTLVATPRFVEASAANVRASIEPLLAGWATHIDLVEQMAVRFAYRGAWVRDEGGQEVLAEYSIEGGDSIRVYQPAREAPAPPPRWLTAEPELVRLLRGQWREVRDGSAKILDRAYFCLTAIENAYGGRKQAADRLLASRALLSGIAVLAASPDQEHARKLTGSGPAEFSAENREWLMAAMPRLIYRCAEIELGRTGLARLTTDPSTWH